MADFLGAVPVRPGMSFDDELAHLADEWNDDGIRAELYKVRLCYAQLCGTSYSDCCTGTRR